MFSSVAHDCPQKTVEPTAPGRLVIGHEHHAVDAPGGLAASGQIEQVAVGRARLGDPSDVAEARAREV